MSKRHQVAILTSTPGRTWAACSTCGLRSKQGPKKNAEAWMELHILLTDSPRWSDAGRAKRLTAKRSRGTLPGKEHR